MRLWRGKDRRGQAVTCYTLAMTAYDIIMVLGSKPATAMWTFPSHVPKSLDTAAELFKLHYAPYIALSGKWALEFDEQNITEPYLECDRMAAYLVAKGVPEERILKEPQSEDTISNLYYQKKLILEPRRLKRILIITADFRLPRINYLAHKIFGPHYRVDFMIVPSKPNEVYPNEAATMTRTRAFLRHMKDGDDSFLKGKFYSAPYYTQSGTTIANVRPGPQPR